MSQYHGPCRRSSRVLGHRSRSRRDASPTIYDLEPPWRCHYIDLGHCRLAKCAARLRNATPSQLETLKNRNLSFLGMAIRSACAYGSCKESELIKYARAAKDAGLSLEDVGKRATSLAAYHGYADLLAFLLDAGCSLECRPSRGESYKSAVRAAVCNGQHLALETLIDHRPADMTSILRQEWEENECTSLYFALKNGQIDMARSLRDHGAMFSDKDLLRCQRQERRRVEDALSLLHPDSRTTKSWSQQLHWSFSTPDRRNMTTVWHMFRREEFLPDELLTKVFLFFGRGWWL